MIQPWTEREGTTLAVIVEHFSQPEAGYLGYADLASATGLPENELTHRLRRLHDDEFIRADRRGSAVAGVYEVLTKGWEVATGQPNAHGDAVEILVGKLADAYERETDPKKKSALARLRTSIRDFALEFGPKAAAELLAKMFS
jgi:hypothetical protein